MRIIFVLISLSAGALLGDVFFHLLPELTEETGGLTTSQGTYILGGIILFFILEKFIIWHHCHGIETPEDHKKGEHSHSHSIGYMNLIGDGLHNFIDGMIIAASYLINIPIGIATTIAVILHEIPQEIGDFGVLIHSGFSTKKALLFNLLSASLSILGALIAYSIGGTNEFFLEAIIPIVAGGFIYIAGSDLIPELKKHTKVSESLLQLTALMLGMLMMYGLIFIEPEGHHSHHSDDIKHHEQHDEDHDEDHE